MLDLKILNANVIDGSGKPADYTVTAETITLF